MNLSRNDYEPLAVAEEAELAQAYQAYRLILKFKQKTVLKYW